MILPEKRKENSEQKLIEKGIGINKSLPVIPTYDKIKLKDIDTVCKRAITSLISIQLAFDLPNQNDEDIRFILELMDKYNVKDCVNSKEQKLVNNEFSDQDLSDIVWEYECYWSLVWALGLIDDIEDAGGICDCDVAIHLVSDCDSYDEFKSKCKLRDIEEILDMLDLYYRYHWATVQQRCIDSNFPIGDLNEEVVFERRRGLEWLISDKNDWYDILLDT